MKIGKLCCTAAVAVVSAVLSANCAAVEMPYPKTFKSAGTHPAKPLKTLYASYWN